MMRIHQVVLLGIISLFVGAWGHCNLRDSCDFCDCCTPVNLTNEEIPDAFKELLPRIWSQNIALTSLGRRYRDLLLDLAETGNAETSNLAIIASIFFNNFIPYLDQKPDACVVAAMINGTVTCVNNQDETIIQDALVKMKNKFFDVNYDDMLTMILSSGCDFRCGKSPPDPKIKKQSCYKNGFVYNIKGLWSLTGLPYENISPELKKLVLDLYKSKNYVDNFLASTITFALSEITQRLFVNWNPNIIIEAVNLELSDPVDQACCYTRIKRADEVRKLNDQSAISTITNEKAYLAATKCVR